MDSWQTLAVQVRLDKLAVYHAPRGKAPRLLGGDIAVSTTMNTNALRLGVTGQSGFRFDGVSVHARSLDAAKSTTYAYNTSNQLTSSVTNSVTTNYTYDAWGRLLTRTAGTASASYAYRGDKLKQVTSTFPGEASSVAMNYDGLGRRRNRMANGVTPITWWRYGLGWDTVAEYTDNDTDWAVEGLSSVHLPGQGLIKGANPITGVLNYYALDSSANMRASFRNDRSMSSAIEYYPFGQTYSTTGEASDIPAFRQNYKHYDEATKLGFRSGVSQSENPLDSIATTTSNGWDLLDFVFWYWEGMGAPVDLNAAGVTDKARRHRDVIRGVKRQKQDCDNLARRHAIEGCAQSDERFIDFHFNHKRNHDYFMLKGVLFVLGNGSMRGRSVCSGWADCCERRYGYICDHTFLFKDYFDTPLAYFFGYRGEIGFPYLMFGSFEEQSSGHGYW